MRRVLALLLVLAALPARADDLLPPPPLEAAPAPALEAVVAGSTGAQRVQRLLGYIAQYPQGAQVVQAAEEARRLVDQLALSPAQLARTFSARDPGQRLSELKALAAVRSELTVPVVGYVARRDRDLPVRLGAVELLGANPDPESERVLNELLVKTEPQPVRAAALTALGLQGTDSAGQTLLAVAKNDLVPTELRQTALDALKAHYPLLARQLERGVSDSSGGGLATLVGVGSGAYTLGLIGSLSPGGETAGATVGVLGGGVIGGAAVYMLRQEHEISQKDAWFLASAALWSMPVGFWMGSVVDWPDQTSSGVGLRSIMLLSHVGAMWGAWQLKDDLHGGDDALFLLAAAVWSLPVGFTLGEAVAPDNKRSASAVALVAHLATMVGGWALKDSIHSAREAAWLSTAGLWALPVGGFLGAIGDSNPKETGTAAPRCARGCKAGMVTAHLGALAAAWGLKDRLELTGDDLGEINLGAAAGLVTAYGLVQIPTPHGDSRPGLVPLALLPAAGFVASTYFAKDLEMSSPLFAISLLTGGELALASAFAGEAVLHGGGPLGSDDTARINDIERGLALTGVGLAVGAGLAASPWWKPTASDAAVLGFAAFDGNLLGAGLPLLLASENKADTAGQLGLGLGGLVAGGIAASQLKHLKLEGGDGTLVAVGTGFSALQGAGWALFLDDIGVVKGKTTPGLGLTIAGAGGLGVLALSQKLQLSSWESAWTYSGAAWGAWLGYWSAYVAKYDADGRSADTAMLGATLIGSDLGLAASALLLSPLVKVTPEEVLFASLCGVSGMTLGTMFAVFVAYDSAHPTIAGANLAGSALGLGIGALLAPRFAPMLKGSGGGGDAGRSGTGLALGVPQVGAMPVLGLDGKWTGYGAMATWQL